MESSIIWFANEVRKALDLHSQGKITPTDCVFNIADAKQKAITMHKNEIEKSYYSGGCDFQEANECRNQKVPYQNDAEYYYKKIFNQKPTQ
jgi:hypothetical protein